MKLSRYTTFLVALFVAAGLAAPPEAQAAATPIGHPAQVAAPVRMDVSPALRDIPPLQVVPEGKKAPENPYIPKSGRTLGPGGSGADEALQQRPGSLNMPAPLVNFEGINNTFGVLPPDTTGDVGPNHFIQWVNLGFAIYDKTGAKIYPLSGSALGNTLWAGFGGACQTSNDGDPQVNYDHLADRWVMSQFALPNFPSGPYYQCFAISTTPDPTGSWYRYAYVVSTTKMNDYPKIGVWPDGYYMTVNQFTGGSSWGGLGVFVYERAKMLAGLSAQQIYFDVGAVNLNYGGALPADLDGPAPPPGTPGYVVEWDDAGWIPGDTVDTLRVWRVGVDWTNPASSTFGLNASFDANFKITAADAVVLCPSTRACIPQPGTGVRLDEIGDRLMQRLQYRYIGGVGRMTTNLTVDAGGSRAGVRWFQLADPGTGWAMHDQGTYAGDVGNTENRWMGAAALDVQGNLAVGYSVSSAATYPSIRYNGRLAGDSAGTLGVEENLIVGAGSQTSTSNRWGDYSAMLVDPTDDCTFWYTQEYYQTTSAAGWQTRVGSFKFPGCVAGPSGVIQGYVKSTAGGAGIPGATVQIGPSISTATNASGFYSVSVAVGTYDVTASKFGYDPATITGQEVTDGGTTTVADLMLTPTGTYDVDGFVTAAAHHWPLWARIEIRQAGTLIDTLYTSPWNGYYEKTGLPNGFTYQFTVHSMYQGYQDEVRTVTLASGDQIQNFTLLAASGNPAYNCVLQGGINEQFEGAFPPLGWTVKNNGPIPNNVWKRNDAWGRANLTLGTGFAAAADSDKAGSGSGPFNTELWSPQIAMPATPRNLRFKSAFRRIGDVGTVDVSTNGGNTWVTLLTFTATAVTEPTIDMTAYANQTIVLRWKYVSGSWEYYWQVDDVRTETRPALPLLGETFEGTFPPSGWTVVNNAANPGNVWKRNDVWGEVNFTGGTGFSAAASSDKAGSGSGAFNTELRSPSVVMPATPLTLKFKNNLRRLATDTGYLDVSTNGGTTWTNLLTITATEVAERTVNMATYASQTIILRWKYTSGDWEYRWQIDDVSLAAASSPPVVDNPTLLCDAVGGSMVAGFVTDGNTTNGITGAQVARDLGGLATTAAATGNLPGGFYYMFSPSSAPAMPNGPSTRTFTASKTGYGNVAHSVNLVPDTVNRLDFALPAASLSLGGWPFVVDGRLTPDGLPVWDKTQAFSILNTGGLPANVRLSVNALSTTWLRRFPAFVPAAPTAPKKASIERAPTAPVISNAKRYPGLAGPLAAIPAFGVAIYPTGNFVRWPDASVPGTWNVISGASTSYYGGDFLNGDFTKLYTLEASLNQLHTINTATGAVTVVGPSAPNAGQTWTGLTGSSDGNVYASGTNCSASTLYRIDPATGHPTAVGPITNGACVIDLAANAAGEIYAVDIVSDNLLKINPATGAGTVVGPLGVAANYAQGMDFEEVSGTLYWAAYTTGGELRTINTATGASYLVGAFPGGAEVGAFAIASGGGSSVPWLTLTPTEGVVPAAGQLDIGAEFFPGGVNPAHYGLFRAVIKSTNDTPAALPEIPVFFTKAFWDVPRGFWADAHIHALAGVRVTRGCGGGNYCPSSNINRAEMAVTMVRAMYGPDYAPPPAIGIFADVEISDTNTTADYIEQLYNDGVVNGCGAAPLRYCPNDLVNRAAMAKYLVNGLGIATDPPTGYFTDVSGTVFDAFAPYVEALFREGITLGCGDHLYCPAATITRDQLAVFLVRGLGLPMYTHPAAP
ncbi:MAG: choice-of-anchor J domain-containing protein [Chloroflexota bacterium]|nr:choice-of-anchor J domain-containing protein [Chloroflexota bacterium]